MDPVRNRNPEFPAEPGDAPLQPAEWAPHDAVWLAWPSNAAEWGPPLAAARNEFAAFCAAIADVDPATGAARGETLRILVLDEPGEAEARAALGDTPAHYHRIPFGDIWLRDTGPIFVHRRDRSSPDVHGEIAAVRFRWNGWGHKYEIPGDESVGDLIATLAAAPSARWDAVLEGGAVEPDGAGTVLTTRQCLLNRNRNPGLDQAELERLLYRALGAERVIWLDRGLHNDHTDGHIDTLARFVAPGRCVCMEAREASDPNREALTQIIRDLEAARDVRGQPLEVVRMPSPGTVLDAAGQLMPASYANFYIGNSTVSVPQYGVPADDDAAAVLAGLFPGRRVVQVPSRAILTGGGALHCISQQQPRAAARGQVR
jgi:agmatine deiminase